MSLSKWRSRLPVFNRKSRDFFNLGKFFEDLEENLNAVSTNRSGLSVSSDAESIYVEAAIPGLSGKDVNVTVDDNHVLWIKGERKIEEKDKERKFYRQSQTSFSYCVPLGDEIESSVEPEAVVKDGMVRVKFAKKKEKQTEAKKIQVKEE